MWQSFSTADHALAGWVRGDGDQLALVLHGGPGLTDYTEGLADEVLAGGDGALRVARYQQRGQAPSSTEGELTVAEQVADALAVLDTLDARSAFIVGHSWGGHLAMQIAVTAADRVKGLLLVDSLGAIGDGGTSTMAPTMNERIGAAALAAIDEVATLGLDPDETETRQFALRWPGYFRDAAAASPMPPIAASARVGSSVVFDAFRLLGEGVLERGLPTIDVPSLHLIGAYSPIEPAANERTAALMKHAIVEIHETGHFPWLEDPGSIAAATRRLLAAAR